MIAAIGTRAPPLVIDQVLLGLVGHCAASRVNRVLPIFLTSPRRAFRDDISIIGSFLLLRMILGVLIGEDSGNCSGITTWLCSCYKCSLAILARVLRRALLLPAM